MREWALYGAIMSGYPFSKITVPGLYLSPYPFPDLFLCSDQVAEYLVRIPRRSVDPTTMGRTPPYFCLRLTGAIQKTTQCLSGLTNSNQWNGQTTKNSKPDSRHKSRSRKCYYYYYSILYTLDTQLDKDISAISASSENSQTVVGAYAISA